MPNLLLELFSEEIPARMQSRAAEDLQKLVTNALVDAGLVYESAGAFSTPRRLTLSVTGIPATQPDTRDERKGPRVGAPDKAVEGFLRSAGLTSIDQAEIKTDAKKGDFYIAVVESKGETAEQVIAGIIPTIIQQFPWPKSMKWGSGNLRWVRPLQSVLCLFGEGEDAKVIPFEIEGIISGNTTSGHRFMAPDEFVVTDFEDYEARLENARVVLESKRRQEIILHEAKELTFALGLELVDDKSLLHETAGLVEWPVVMMGSFDETFLEVPPEVLTSAMKSHQKCFSVRDPKTTKLVNKFLLVSNLEAKDGGKKIVSGNERVINARLNDAKFFWHRDLDVKLEDQMGKLDAIIFHEKLGSQSQRVARIEELAKKLAPLVGADPEQTYRAAKLCKADLVTEMVGEFPELQGLMGRYYALAQGEVENIAKACEDHYKPQGPSDDVPVDPVSIAVALADKLDTLVGFWAINEKPTGSKDPYALRRAALGVIRIILENQARVHLGELISSHLDLYRNQPNSGLSETFDSQNLDAFFADRLKVHLRDRGIGHDLIDAVFSTSGGSDLVATVKRIEALREFLKTEDGENLLAGYKRAANIVRIEEKKDGPSIEYSGEVDKSFFEQDEEKSLHAELQMARATAAKALKTENFSAAMAAMAPLRGPVDLFFEAVTVNADDPAIRRNRLCLLNQIRKTLGRVADFSKIEG